MDSNCAAYQEYTVLPELGALQILEKLPTLPWTAYVGAAGMPGKSPHISMVSDFWLIKYWLREGKTAYMGWKEFSDAKPVRYLSAPHISSDVDFTFPREKSRSLPPAEVIIYPHHHLNLPSCNIHF
jgi:hypothetical protein